MKVGVIGTGNMGENHVRTYLSLNEYCELVGVYDNNDRKGQEIAKKYNVRQFQSIDDLLETVDAVSIVVPTEFHYEVGLKCIQHDVHMLMEKPITSTIAQADDLIEKAEKAGVTIQVGHIELFNPLIQVLTKELANEDIIGIVFHRLSPYSDRIKDVDVVKDLMIHDLYILQKILQDNDIEFYALGKIIENTPKHVVVITRSSKGITTELMASFKSVKKMRIIQIFTEDAFIEADILNKEIFITRSDQTHQIKLDDTIQPLNAQLVDFINCIKFNNEPTVTGRDGIKALHLSNEISKLIQHKGN